MAQGSVLSRLPQVPQVTEQLARLYGRLGWRAELLTTALSLTQRFPDDRDALGIYLNALESDGSLAEADQVAARIKKLDPDEVMLTAIDAGADDVEVGDDIIEVYTEFQQLAAVREALRELLPVALVEMAAEVRNQRLARQIQIGGAIHLRARHGEDAAVVAEAAGAVAVIERRQQLAHRQIAVAAEDHQIEGGSHLHGRRLAWASGNWKRREL